MKNIRKEIAIWCQFVAFLVIWVAILLFSGVDLKINWEALKKFPEVIVVYSVLHLVFTAWAWRLPLFQGWLVPFPDSEGTWAGTLQSTWKDPKTDQPKPPIPILLVIKQSFSTISCVMHSKESTSYSNAAQLSKDDDSGAIRLSYNYTNRPRASVRDRSEIHDGAAILSLIRKPERVLAGEYWTSRRTTGDLQVIFKSRKLEDGFPTDVI
ncbi:hypothetical protein HY090_00860 [Candidatus Kaiserbacteria bacterium]|nr:hypothetical protein [Candidatus Kaiserbacteria bacterium]